MKFSNQEFRELSISIAVIVGAFTIVILNGISGIANATQSEIEIALITAIIAIAPAFILHEMAHKWVAQKYGCWSEFRYWPFGLLFALMTSMMGVMFAAPGAVHVKGRSLNKQQNGYISLAGPAMNIVLALLFLGIGLLGIEIAFFAMYINLFLAGFNMIPVNPLDGSKIWDWNKKVYFGVWAVIIVLVASVLI